MSLRAQAKVLRVLQEGEFEPVGSTQTIKVDVRILAATHKDLAAQVRAGAFREDLFFRLNVIPLRVPPLRERAGDVRLLGEHFLGVSARRHERPTPRLSAKAWKLLEDYRWDGNIRELMNVMERMVILRRGTEIGPGDLPMEITQDRSGSAAACGVMTPGEGRASWNSTVPPGDTGPYEGTSGEVGGEPRDGKHLTWREARDAYERAFIRAALARHDGKIARAAEELGFERTHLHKRIRELGLREEGL